MDRQRSTTGRIVAATVGGAQRHNAPIDLLPYDPRWPEQCERERSRILALLVEQVLIMEHVGSTAVPGLAAKPIVDMLLVLADSSDEPAYLPQLESGGYLLRIREPDWYEHRMCKGPDTDINLHVFSLGCVEIKRMLNFRDWLRSNQVDRERYEETKRQLAARQWDYVQDYADAKSQVVEEIIARAMAADISP